MSPFNTCRRMDWRKTLCLLKYAQNNCEFFKVYCTKTNYQKSSRIWVILLEPWSCCRCQGGQATEQTRTAKPSRWGLLEFYWVIIFPFTQRIGQKSPNRWYYSLQSYAQLGNTLCKQMPRYSDAILYISQLWRLHFELWSSLYH